MTEDDGDPPMRRPYRRGLERREGLTNEEVAMEGLDVGSGLINGMGNGARPEMGRGPPLFGRSRKRRRAVREALERKASEPLPGSDGH